MRARPLEPHDDAALEALLSRSSHHDYRLYPRMPADAGPRLLREDFASRSASPAAGGVWMGESLVAAGLLQHLPWDSKHFGLAMGRVSPLVVDPAWASCGALDLLLDWLLDRAREAALDHLTARVDSADLPALQALEARGFRLMDCLVTYFCDLHREAPSVKQLGVIRDYEPSDLPEIVGIAERMLGEYPGRFTFDPWLPRNAVRRFYVEWVRNACAGHMADRVLVGERHGRPVGFLGYRMLPRPLKALAVRVAGQGLCAVLPEGTGLYAALLARAIAVDRVVTYDFAEFDTSIQNILPQRVFQRLGFQLARQKYTLHRGRP